MSDTEKKVLTLLNTAKPKGEVRNSFRNLLILFALSVVLVLYAWKLNNEKKTDEKIHSLQSRIHKLEEQNKVFKNDMNMNAIIDKEVMSYIDRLQIRDIRVINMSEFEVSGKIINTGNREVNDITLSVFCLDENDKPLSAHTHIAVSNDGNPLKKYQRRRFTATFTDVPEDAKDVSVVITDIEFVN